MVAPSYCETWICQTEFKLYKSTFHHLRSRIGSVLKNWFFSMSVHASGRFCGVEILLERERKDVSTCGAQQRLKISTKKCGHKFVPIRWQKIIFYKEILSCWRAFNKIHLFADLTKPFHVLYEKTSFWQAFHKTNGKTYHNGLKK